MIRWIKRLYWRWYFRRMMAEYHRSKPNPTAHADYRTFVDECRIYEHYRAQMELAHKKLLELT